MWIQNQTLDATQFAKRSGCRRKSPRKIQRFFAPH